MILDITANYFLRILVGRDFFIKSVQPAIPSKLSNNIMHSKTATSWQQSSRWYNQSQGLGGSYYYEKIVLPKTLALLELKPNFRILDLGCGQGILERALSKENLYLGIDLAKDLIKYAIEHRLASNHQFVVGDITKPLPIASGLLYDKIVVILVMQNLAGLAGLFANISQHLIDKGAAVIILNHPYFRIPRQSSWQIDEANKIQYRRINRYQTDMKVPIVMNPGQKEAKKITWSFHYPLWQISQAIFDHGLVIDKIEEWVSDKTSVGKAAKMENLARHEFPLFMALRIVKKKD